MRIKNELQDIYDDLWNVQYCCYCLQPKGEAISCCQESDFVPFSSLDKDCRQEIAQELLNG